MLAEVISGQDHAVQDTFWYRPDYLPDKVFLYVEQFIADSLNTSGTILQCYTHLLHRTTITKKYLITFHPNQTTNDESYMYRPFGVLELSDTVSADRKNLGSARIRLQVQSSFWIHLMFQKFDMDPDYKEGQQSCRQIYMCIETEDDDGECRVKYCGKRRPWNQVREHNALLIISSKSNCLLISPRVAISGFCPCVETSSRLGFSWSPLSCFFGDTLRWSVAH